MSKLLCIIVLLFTTQSVFAESPAALSNRFQEIEKAFDGKIGVYAVNTANQQVISYRALELFPLQSTFKAVLVAAILQKSEKNPAFLQKKISYSKKDIVSWSPVTLMHLSTGQTIAELCRATITYSDNTAANLLMKQLGGPGVLTQFAQKLGDTTFRINHYETQLNSDPKLKDDTSTPKNMAIFLKKLISKNILSPKSTDILLGWMKDSVNTFKMQDNNNWVVANKTGSGYFGISNNIAVVWPKDCGPVIYAIYTVGKTKDAEKHDDIVTAAMNNIFLAFEDKDLCIKKAMHLSIK